ncbi:TRI33-like protein [Mya arenaria]|uniref:TRI33-like protein n=1 Tax=Mya arenaria TaxID=6604 RepID=A0ABY7EQ64_MYAAR|nr:TRI33-like protein [Mya arenaria]
MASKHTKSFKDSMSMASDLIHDFVCSPCHEDKLNTEAKHFCRDCSKYYCDKCLTFHSKIHKEHTVLGRKDVDKWVGQGDSLISCDLHPQEVIKLLCEDHAEMCCHLCVSLNHRMCRSISLISDLAKGVYKMADFMQLPCKVAKVTTSLNQFFSTDDNSDHTSALTLYRPPPPPPSKTDQQKLLPETQTGLNHCLPIVVYPLSEDLQDSIQRRVPRSFSPRVISLEEVEGLVSSKARILVPSTVLTLA